MKLRSGEKLPQVFLIDNNKKSQSRKKKKKEETTQKWIQHVEKKFHTETNTKIAKVSRLILSSKSRDIVRYPLASHCVLPIKKKEFKSVYRLDVVRLTILNANPTISSVNHSFSYIAINDVSVSTVIIPDGTYNAVTDLLDLMVNTMNSQFPNRRISYSYNYLTTEITFTIYDLRTIPLNDPCSISDSDLTVLSINFPAHGLQNGQTIIITGVTGQLDNSFINNNIFTVLNVVDDAHFTVQISADSGQISGTFGGKAVVVGTICDFRLINTPGSSILPVIGFNPLSSSEIINGMVVLPSIAISQVVTTTIAPSSTNSFDEAVTLTGESVGYLMIGDVINARGMLFSIVSVMSNNVFGLNAANNMQLFPTRLVNIHYISHGLQVGDTVQFYVGLSLQSCITQVRAVLDPDHFIVSLDPTIQLNGSNNENIFLSAKNIGARPAQRSQYYSDQNLLESVLIDLGGEDHMILTCPTLNYISNISVAADVKGTENILCIVYLSGSSASKLFDGVDMTTIMLADQDLNELEISLRYLDGRGVSLHGLDYTLVIDLYER